MATYSLREVLVKSKLFLFILFVLSLSFAQSTFSTVTVQDLANAQEVEYIVLDVRQSEEFAEGHVPNAVLIPLGKLEARASELPKDTTLYVICRSGNRSRQASDILVNLGFKDVRNIDGGFIAWENAGYEVAFPSNQ
jgi:rhodanese-related sulfurtransferase